jgi:DNA-binding NarL/FixJ family response regulator
MVGRLMGGSTAVDPENRGNEGTAFLRKERDANGHVTSGRVPWTTGMVKILLVDDHPIVRRGLRDLLAAEKDLVVCGEAGSAEDAMQLIEETQPDLAIVDISLSETGGLELIKQIKAANEHIKVLVASMHDESVFAERALRAGALGYVEKARAPEQLVHAIRQVLQDRIYLSHQMTERFLNRARGGKPTKSSSIDSLTDRELEVFELFGQGLTTKLIAERLHRSVKTIETHRESIKHKLGLGTSNELTHRATLWLWESRGRQPTTA